MPRLVGVAKRRAPPAPPRRLPPGRRHRHRPREGRPHDVLPIGFQRLRGALELHLVERSGEPDEFLLYPLRFRTRPMDRTTLHRWFKKCLARAGMPPDIQLHELRHTAAQALYDLSEDIVLAQQLLRHGDIRTTRGYLRGSLERLRAAQAALEQSWQ